MRPATTATYLVQSRGGAYAGGAIVAALAGGVSVVWPLFGLAVVLGVTGLAVVAAIAARFGWALAVVIPLLAGALLTPQPLSLAAQAGTMVLAVSFAITSIFRQDRRAPIGLAFLAVIAYWTLQVLNSNVPDVGTGLLGLRKTTVVFAGLMIGVFWPYGSTKSAETFLTRLLLLLGIAALVVHLLLPGVESSFSRSGDVYTSLFMGEDRMQGFFAGPFHVALLGSFLALWGVYSYASRAGARWESGLYLGVGIALLTFSAVRTGFIAVAVGIVLLPLLRPGASTSRYRTAGLAALTIVVVGALLATEAIQSDAVRSISQLSSDNRALGRIDTWVESLAAIQASPLTGWGAGSAGSTLGDAFGAGLHVTSHNAALAWAVEGGLVGLFLVLAMLGLFVRASRELFTISHAAPAAIVPFAVFGFTGEVGEALPISLFLAILVGLRAQKEDT